MTNDITLHKNIDLLIKSYASGKDLTTSYYPGFMRQVKWGFLGLFGYQCLNSKKKYLADCRKAEEQFAKELERKEKEDKKNQKIENRKELEKLVGELSQQVDTLESQYDKMAKICTESEDEERKLELKIDSLYELDLTKLGQDKSINISTEEIPDYIRQLRNLRIELRINDHTNPISFPESDEELEENKDDVISAYLRQATFLSNGLEVEEKERQKATIKLRALPMKLEAAERQRTLVHDSLLKLIERKVMHEETLELFKMGIDIPQLIISSTNTDEEVTRKIELVREDYRKQQQELNYALLRLEGNQPRQLEGLVEDSKLIEASTREVQGYLNRVKQ